MIIMDTSLVNSRWFALSMCFCKSKLVYLTFIIIFERENNYFTFYQNVWFWNPWRLIKISLIYGAIFSTMILCISLMLFHQIYLNNHIVSTSLHMHEISKMFSLINNKLNLLSWFDTSHWTLKLNFSIY